MSKRENHHILPQEIQRRLADRVYDGRTISLEDDFHHMLTYKMRYEGLSPIESAAYIDLDSYRQAVQMEGPEED